VDADQEIRTLTTDDLVGRIEKLRRERGAMIVAHNYQVPAIQDLADVVGDSLDLARRATESDAPLIVFCGVHVMAETVAILAPQKTVLIPDREAGCSLAAMITVQQLRQWKAEYPDAVVVAYINTDARVKAESDYCCTSGNAVAVIRSIPQDREILFLPDFFLGCYLQHATGRKLRLWLGECHVHAGIRSEHIDELMQRYPAAHLLLHPECGCISQCLSAVADGALPQDRTFVLGTGGMVRHARSCNSAVDIVGTEVGMLHRLHRENPEKTFIPLREDAICPYMKAITLAKLYRSLRDLVDEVRVPSAIAANARRSLKRMIDIV
jgi:quinolinate synthase